jgi:hypothetical protein
MTAVRVALVLGLTGTALADEPVPVNPTAAPEAPSTPVQEPTPAPVPGPDGEAAPPEETRAREIKVVTPGERSRNNKLMIGGTFGAAVIVGAIGGYFHLDSRDASNQVSSSIPTGKPWTPARAELVDRAESSRSAAIVAYSVGGAIVVGAIVAYIMTEPKSETSVIRTTAIAPTDGGAVVTTGWSF